VQGPRVLVVDDDPVALDAVRTLLRQRGYQTGMCLDGLQALETISQGGWDLVILDLGLPSPDPDRAARFDGVKVLQWMARLGHRVPVLVFTSSQDPALAQEALAAGAIAVIHKGDPIQRFLQAIQQAVAPPPEEKPQPSGPTEVIWNDHDDRIAGS
jgi:CheY-like chemotaxis protein